MDKAIHKERCWMVGLSFISCIFGMLCLRAIEIGLPIGWILGIPFLAAACVGAWQATRDDAWYEKRVAKQQAQKARYMAWKAQHPRTALVFEIVGIFLSIAILVHSIITGSITQSVLKWFGLQGH